MSDHARLPLRAKVGYGVADFGVAGVTLVLQLYLFEYYTVVVGLSPWIVGGALGVALLWDAVSDPFMGLLCDRTRTRWGRFFPWMLGGAVGLGLAFGMLFHPPEGAGPVVATTWLLLSCLLVNTGLTLVGVPHLALGGAMTPDSGERTEVYGWRLVFGTLGLLFGIGAPLLAASIGNLDTSEMDGLRASRESTGWSMGLAVVASVAVTTIFAWRYGRHAHTEAPASWKSVWRELAEVSRNPFFLPLLISFVVVSIGRAMNSVLALPYYKYSLGLSEGAVQQWVLGLFAFCIILSIALWIPLSRRYGKKWPGFAGMLVLGILTCVGYPLFPREELTGPMVAAVIGGVAVGAIILFESMVTDVADADRERLGQDREGVYFGLWRLGQKVANAGGVFATGLVLEAIGFVEGAQKQETDTERSLAWLFGPGVGVFFLLGAFIFARGAASLEGQSERQGATTEAEKTDL